MSATALRTFIIAVTGLLLSACMGPESPREVTEAFWEATLDGDNQAATEFSTLSDPERHDGFGRDWRGYQPSWGRIVIDGNEASVESTFSAADKDERTFTTFLVRREGKWLVDYQRTEKSVKGGLLGGLFGQLSQLGKTLSEGFNQSADDANTKLDRLLEELEASRDQWSRHAEEAMEDFAEQLRQSLQAMNESIDRALEGEDGQLSDQDRKTLTSLSQELKQSLASLNEESFESLRQNSEIFTTARQKLENLETQALARQQEEWQTLAETFSENMAAFLDALSEDPESP